MRLNPETSRNLKGYGKRSIEQTSRFPSLLVNFQRRVNEIKTLWNRRRITKKKKKKEKKTGRSTEEIHRWRILNESYESRERNIDAAINAIEFKRAMLGEYLKYNICAAVGSCLPCFSLSGPVF